MGKGLFLGVAVIVLAAVFIVLTLNPSPTTNAINEDVLSGNNQVSTNSGNTIELDVIAKQWEFDPAIIEVNEGDTVLLHITSVDVDHGIAIPQFGVSENLPVGKTIDIQFIADKAGEYTFFCNVYCGSDHRSMTGTLIVN